MAKRIEDLIAATDPAKDSLATFHLICHGLLPMYMTQSEVTSIIKLLHTLHPRWSAHGQLQTDHWRWIMCDIMWNYAQCDMTEDAYMQVRTLIVSQQSYLAYMTEPTEHFGSVEIPAEIFIKGFDNYVKYPMRKKMTAPPECVICLDIPCEPNTITQLTHLDGTSPHPDTLICTQCLAQLTKCPFCRAPL